MPEGSGPVTSRPHRINPILAKVVGAILNQYFAAGLVQLSTALHSSPLVVVLTPSGGARITVNYKKLNDIIRLGRLLIPRVDEVLDSLGKGRVFSLFDLVSSFHQITTHKDAVPPQRVFMIGWLCLSAAAHRLVGLSRSLTRLPKA